MYLFPSFAVKINGFPTIQAQTLGDFVAGQTSYEQGLSYDLLNARTSFLEAWRCCPEVLKIARHMSIPYHPEGQHLILWSGLALESWVNRC